MRDAGVVAPGPGGWGAVWQIPAVLVSVGLISLGIWVASNRATGPDFSGALDDVERLMGRGEFPPAARLLRDTIEPKLRDATPADRARFHALVADWLYLARANPDDTSSFTEIDRQYGAARKLGVMLTPPQVERWSRTLLGLGRPAEAREQVTVLEGLAAGSPEGAPIRAIRNAVLREIVERSLESLDDPELVLSTLDQYRLDRFLAPADELWAALRQAEVRLDEGRAQAALDHLLVDMRRVEQRATGDDELAFGEAYVVLARAYLELGRLDDAEFQLEQALLRLGGAAPPRGDALVLLGQLVAARGEHEEALSLMDQVVRDFRMTPSSVPALLGRAELRGILGDHEGSLEDYAQLAMLSPDPGPRRADFARRVAQSLVDRHDAALAMRRHELALRYARLAELFFADDELPANVLARIAATSRQLGDRLVAEAEQGTRGVMDPAARKEASANYRRAGDYYLRRANALKASTYDDDGWAESLWLAADSYDLAGDYERAANYFVEYLAGRANDDARWPLLMYRLAQAQQAQMMYEEAALTYQRLREERPRTALATRSAVPLARVLVTLDRRGDARALLEGVLEGDLLDPDAPDYRNALVELGRIHHETGDFVAAIERLEEARARYPGDERAIEVVYRLADARRRLGLGLFETASSDASLPPGEIDRLEREGRRLLGLARDGYGEVCTALDEDRIGGPVLDSERLRNAWRYRADCAFHLGEYEAAIDLYDLVARRYADHPASINALVQIHNCFMALGEPERARAAHLRAQSRLERMPPEAFEAPDALMDREAWERWLRNSPVGRSASVAPREAGR